MGYRTVVILNNDRAYHWENDPGLGVKIAIASEALMCDRADPLAGEFGAGRVVQVTHCDEQSLMLVDSLDATVLCGTHWMRGQSEDEKQLAMLKTLADKLGYTVSKKRKVK